MRHDFVANRAWRQVTSSALVLNTMLYFSSGKSYTPLTALKCFQKCQRSVNGVRVVAAAISATPLQPASRRAGHGATVGRRTRDVGSIASLAGEEDAGIRSAAPSPRR